MNPTEQYHTVIVHRIAPIQRYQAGIDSVEKLDIKWLIPVSTCHTVEQCSLVGSQEDIPA